MTLLDQHKLQLCSPGVLAHVCKLNKFALIFIFLYLCLPLGCREAPSRTSLPPFSGCSCLFEARCYLGFFRWENEWEGKEDWTWKPNNLFHLERNRKLQPLVASGCICGLIAAVKIKANTKNLHSWKIKVLQLVQSPCRSTQTGHIVRLLGRVLHKNV